MKVLIIEDEQIAALQLSASIQKIRPEYTIEGICDTVKSTVKWVEENGMPDLAFFDIQLGDGISFGIFDQIEFHVPIIFITAYDDYALKAFKVNSIDYLLKPIILSDLERAILKFERQASQHKTTFSPDLIASLKNSLQEKKFKKRFLIKIGDKLKSFDVEDVRFFYSMEKATFAQITNGKDFLLDQPLDTIEKIVDPALFFRINRKYLVSQKAITAAHTYNNSRLKLIIEKADNNDFLVAREKVKAFKNWLEGGT
jgi:DNA-binding LytR/AlgR family response regulator